MTETAVALGTFDGLHTGHKAVIACTLSKKERGLIPFVMLFDSHPLLTLTGSSPASILQDDLREERIREMGAQIKYISFSEISDYSAEEFFDKIIVGRFNARAVCCGENYTFGKGGKGDCRLLASMCAERNMEFDKIPLVRCDFRPVSSSRIREEIVKGNIAKANEMLGCEFAYRSVVKSGFHRGHLIGAPTGNQYFPDCFCIPKYGVYASAAVFDGREYPAVTNIGVRPTFENSDLRSETCIIGFEGNLYGKSIEIRLIDRIRDEKKFNSAEELGRQINIDAQKSARIFEKRNADV